MNQWGNTEGPASRDPGRIRLEHGFLLLSALALLVAALLIALDRYTPADFDRGIYSILTGLFVVGWSGYVVRSGQRRLQREMVGEVKRLHAAIAELREERDAQRSSPQWAPPWGRGQLRAVGGTYASQTHMEVTTQPLPQRPGLDAETIADAREIARKMLGRDQG